MKCCCLTHNKLRKIDNVKLHKSVRCLFDVLVNIDIRKIENAAHVAVNGCEIRCGSFQKDGAIA